MRIIYLAIFFFFIIFAFPAASPAYADDPKPPAANTQENATKPFPRFNPTTAAEDALYKTDNLDVFGNPSAEPIDALVEKYTSNDDLKPLLARMFSVADGYVGNVNKRMAEAQTAARSCDRARYDASIDRLFTAYVKASLYLQRKLDNIDALEQASSEYEQNNPIEQGKRRWSLFWAGVHDTLGGNEITEITPSILEILNKNANSSRYYILGQAYSQAYGDILKRMNEIIKTADYPQYQDCDEPITGPTLEDADAALAEALAAQKAMDEIEPELAEQDRQFAKLKAGMDKLIGDANLPDTNLPRGGAANDGSAVDNAPITQSDISADPQMNADGSFAFPDMPVPTADVIIDIPDMPKLEEVPKNSPLAKYQANPCGQNPKKVCKVLLKEFRTECVIELKSFYKICKKGPSISSCEKRCEANWQQGVHEQALASLAKRHIRAVYGASGKTEETDFENKEAEIKENENRIKQIGEDAKKRVVHIYINENTDMIIRHAGKQFKPKPPLRYSGTEGGGLFRYERNTLDYLNARNKQLRQEIDSIIDGAYDGNTWFPIALSKWTADAEKSDGFCPISQNDNNRDTCMEACAGDNPSTVQNVCYSSYVPQLALPYGRTYLYPPGHPQSDPKRGVK